MSPSRTDSSRFLLLCLFSLHLSTSEAVTCDYGQELTFELVTGFVYSASSYILDSKPGTLQLSDCLERCLQNDDCQSVNYETGLCVLFAASGEDYPGALTTSQFPVYTLYGQKICMHTGKKCYGRPWAFERVPGHSLQGHSKKRVRVSSRTGCMEACFLETSFSCRSANYEYVSELCYLSSIDRHALPSHTVLVPISGTDYLESNCVDEPVKMCEFTKLRGRILKTVDTVYQDVKSLDECRGLCVSANYRCHTYDYGDTGDRICRLSHHSSTTLAHIQDPYLEIPGTISYEMLACYNVSIRCQATGMVAKVQTNKVFNGKIYSKARPNSCVYNVENSLDFELQLGYHDINCDVTQTGSGRYSSEIIIQHHDQIVTSQDLGLSVHCQYRLENTTVVSHHGATGLNVKGSIPYATATEGAKVISPNVTMRITNRNGGDIRNAQVGDPLALRFEINDHYDAYEIYVRELIALDGIDQNEILLIDDLGCPTDQSIMGPLEKVDRRTVHAPFDAFKFPSSDIVQFKALVTPCVPKCQPRKCSTHDYNGLPYQVESYGRRRREALRHGRSLAMGKNSSETEEPVLVVQSIQIVDKFSFDHHQNVEEEVSISRLQDEDPLEVSDSQYDIEDYPHEEEPQEKNALPPLFDAEDVDWSLTQDMINRHEALLCLDMLGIVICCVVFLFFQFILIVLWAFVWQRKRRATRHHNHLSSLSPQEFYPKNPPSPSGGHLLWLPKSHEAPKDPSTVSSSTVGLAASASANPARMSSRVRSHRGARLPKH